MNKFDIGIYGLGVMGRNLALNLHDRGHWVSVFNKKMAGEEKVVEQFLSGAAKETAIAGYQEEAKWVASLDRPRILLLMVKAGSPVDSVIDHLLPLLEKGDILIDGGNSHYKDTNRRLEKVKSRGVCYIGMGISGGETGARRGPSLMPGGDQEAWPHIQPILQSIAAKAEGEPCCRWMGPAGAGHFVKMVHNGIEYGIMQLIAECYHLMHEVLQMSNNKIARTFSSWDKGLLQSYLVQITAKIFRTTEEDGSFVIDQILDKAGQKGTGRWTAQAALELGVPAPVIMEAVIARSVSSFKDLREKAAGILKHSGRTTGEGLKVSNLQDLLTCGTIIAFSEGFWLIQAANHEYGWNISASDVANVWREGCIIRSGILEPICQAYNEASDLAHLLLSAELGGTVGRLQGSWRKAIATGLQLGIPLPASSAALSHYDSLATRRLPANLIQAQRDYFGAHTYERVDQPRDTFFHTEWEDSSA